MRKPTATKRLFVATALSFGMATTLSANTAHAADDVHVKSTVVSSTLSTVLGTSVGTGGRYRAHRDVAVRAIRASAELAAELAQIVDAATFSEETFEEDARAAIVLAHAISPDEVNKLDNLNGLTASHYLKRRRPRAGAVNELVKRRVNAALLYERLAFTRDESLAQVTSLNSLDAFPGYKKSRAQAFVEQERAGHVEALVHAISRSGHPIAVQALVRHLRQARGSDRATTVLALGNTHSPRVFQTLVDEVDGDDVNAQQTAVIALGRLRSVDATRVIANLSRNPGALRMTAIRALGAAATTRATDVDAEKRLKLALDTLVPLLSLSVDEAFSQEEANAVVQTLSQLKSPMTLERVQNSDVKRAEIVRRRLTRVRRTR